MRETLTKWVKGNVAQTAIKIAASKVNFFEEGKKADTMMDQQFGAAVSERIQRGTLAGVLFSFIRGLYAESPQAYIAALKAEIANAKKKGK